MIRKIYFMGIKGVGMASLAEIAKEAGFIVGGSDVEDEFITDRILKQKGIEVMAGFNKQNPADFFGTTPVSECLMIITGAHQGFANSEAEYAQNKGVQIITHGEAVGLFMSGKLFNRELEGISVAGSHGKTTITAMIATFLTKLNLDPSYAIGTSEVGKIGAAGHYGKGKYFVAEADEYMAAPTIRNPKFLYQTPKYLIINNIDFDHPDFFNGIEDVKNAFKQLISNLAPDGTLIMNGDDGNIEEVINDILTRGTPATRHPFAARVITYGTGEDNEFKISNFEQNGFDSHFSVSRGDTLIGRFKLSVPGYHNAKNALSAIALLMELGVSPRDIERVLPEFKGSKRRMELVGKTENGIEIIDDYAHHPEEIRKTFEAVRVAFPDKKLTVVFQAHTFGRTKALEQEFVSAFAGVDEIIILPTFASKRSNIEQNIEEDRAFVEKVRKLNSNVKLIENDADVVKYLSNLHGNSLIITMGAGDVYKVSEKLCKKQITQ